MSPTYRHKYKYFHSTVQRAKDRRQKFHFCRLPFDVRPRNVKLNLSNSRTYLNLYVFNCTCLDLQTHNLFCTKNYRVVRFSRGKKPLLRDGKRVEKR